jgi:hypothetical protein
MNDRWQRDGGRWNSDEKIRVSRLFRHHVRTPSNPLGRIHRESCWFCVQNALKGGYPRLEHLPPVAGHHVDYARPFRVVWCCESHHRQVDHGTLQVPQRAICDYSSLVVVRPGGRREARKVVQLVRRTGTGDAVPF